MKSAARQGARPRQ